MSDSPGAHIMITWYSTTTYRHPFPVSALAEATGRTPEELVADPATLHGTTGSRLMGLLTDHETTTSRLHLLGTEVEIAAAEVAADQPTLAHLVLQACAAVDAEAATGRRTDAGRALAALLSGLRREEVIAR